MSDASAGSFMVTLDLTASGGSVQTSGEIAYNADATGGRTSVQGILEVIRVPSHHLQQSRFVWLGEEQGVHRWCVLFEYRLADWFLCVGRLMNGLAASGNRR